MKCPHCRTGINLTQGFISVGSHGGRSWVVHTGSCPECKKAIINLKGFPDKSGLGQPSVFDELVYPKGISRSPLSPFVDEIFAGDYREACLVLKDSPKSSAALSRRCLQNLIREKEGIKKANLDQEIQAVLDSRKLPSYLADGLDAIRTVGNFGAHPIKSTQSGEIIEVEPGEAEWLLDVLEGLFDFYFVQPAILKKKRDDLNAKLAAAGKPALK